MVMTPRLSSALRRSGTLSKTFSTRTTRYSMAHTTFPSDLPRPSDDGACDHLTDMRLPSISLPSTRSSTSVDISKLTGLSIIFCYPRSGAPQEKIPPEWDAIPGARGCTPQACSFRDNLPALKKHGVDNLFGVSTQNTAYQQELHERVHLPYELLSDEKLQMVTALKLPVFEYNGQKLIKRLSLAVENQRIVKWWYPVFPPDSNVHEILQWLQQRSH